MKSILSFYCLALYALSNTAAAFNQPPSQSSFKRAGLPGPCCHRHHSSRLLFAASSSLNNNHNQHPIIDKKKIVILATVLMIMPPVIAVTLARRNGEELAGGEAGQFLLGAFGVSVVSCVSYFTAFS